MYYYSEINSRLRKCWKTQTQCVVRSVIIHIRISSAVELDEASISISIESCSCCSAAVSWSTLSGSSSPEAPVSRLVALIGNVPDHLNDIYCVLWPC